VKPFVRLAWKKLGAPRPSVAGSLLVAVALSIGIPSLALPFGHDQGLYAYVAREWLHGRIPYRDVFDHKTPGIYVVHLLSLALLGEHTYAIRVADLACVLTLGALVARLVTPRGERSPPGLIGLGCAVASILHYGFFNYWDTAQSELWYTTLGIGAVTAGLRIEKPRLALVTAGVLAALAMIMKPPSIWYGSVAFVVAVGRALDEPSARTAGRATRLFGSAAWFAVGAAFPVILTALYFGGHGALRSLVDIVGGANTYYVTHERGVASFAEARERFKYAWYVLFPLDTFAAGALLLGLAFAMVRRDKARMRTYGLGVALAASALAAVSMQQKFYWLHWLTIIGPLAFAIVAGANEVRALLERRLAKLSVLVPAVAIGVGYAFSHSCPLILEHQTKLVVDLWTGRISRESYARNFSLEPLYYYQADIERTSDFLRASARPGDTLCARGFNPELYFLSGLRYEGRFFWTNFLVDPRRAYRREDYLREDREAFARSRPRFVVAVKKEEGRGNLESAEVYFPLGYEVVREFGTMQVLELRTGANP